MDKMNDRNSDSREVRHTRGGPLTLLAGLTKRQVTLLSCARNDPFDDDQFGSHGKCLIADTKSTIAFFVVEKCPSTVEVRLIDVTGYAFLLSCCALDEEIRLAVYLDETR